MSRRFREISPSGVYHVTIRGVNKDNIFHDDTDRQGYLERLKKFNSDERCSILAYCLMDNHVHLLIKDNKDSLSKFMQSVGISYVYYFNKKYQRVGPLFQGRFKSQVIQSEQHLLNSIGYIHRNPVKAGLASLPQRYQWSSFSAFLGKPNGLTHFEALWPLLVAKKEEALKEIVELSYNGHDVDQSKPPCINTVISNVLLKNDLLNPNISQAELAVKRKVIGQIYSSGSFSYRQVAVQLGISKDLIYRTLKSVTASKKILPQEVFSALPGVVGCIK